MNDALFQVNAPGADVEKLVADIRASVEKKMRDGAYADARIARAERTNLVNLRNEDQFLGFYLKCLHDAVFVDISDFEIRARRPSPPDACRLRACGHQTFPEPSVAPQRRPSI